MKMSRMSGRPVKMTMSREDVFRATVPSGAAARLEHVHPPARFGSEARPYSAFPFWSPSGLVQE